jgi:two-component system chemotaxis response regulator CheB
MSATLRVLVVDDTAIYRKIVSDVLRDIPGVEVVGTAIDGALALEKISELQPDVITLDLEMPHVSGVEVLRRLRAQPQDLGIIMLSAFTTQGAAGTTEALRLGAFDFVVKPSGQSPIESAAQLKRQLSERLAAFAASRGRTLPARIDPPAPPQTKVTLSRIVPAACDVPPEVIVLGISTGGPEALTRMIPQLPADLAAPLFIVQHMPPLFTKSLADDLNQRSALRVSEATEGQLARPGDVLIAPGGRHMKLERTEFGPMARLTDDPPENSCRPAVDCLFRAAAHHYGNRALGVVMTGMGSDGTLGCRLLKRQGATIVTQDRESCVVYGMPAMVVEAGLSDTVVPLAEMAKQLVELTGRGAVV